MNETINCINLFMSILPHPLNMNLILLLVLTTESKTVQQRDQQQNEITYSRGVAKISMNKLGNRFALVQDSSEIRPMVIIH